MQIQWLEVENLGPYLGGPHRLNLRPSAEGVQRKPITLIRGLNGAGKTTLLGAIQLAIHGDRAFGGGISQSVYRKRLSDLLPYSDKSVCAKVCVSILYQPREGALEEFVASRSWRLEDGKIKDWFEVALDGEQLDADTWYRWQRFTETNFPPNLAPLFIFDAEKTANLISTSNSKGHSSAYSKVFGLDGPRRLMQDLDGLIRKLTKESLTAEDDARLTELESQEEEFRSKQEKLVATLVDFRTERVAKREELSGLDQELGISHEDYARQRDELNSEIARTREGRSRLSQEMISVWGGCAPLMLCKNLADKMLTRVAEDRKSLQSYEFGVELKVLTDSTLAAHPKLNTKSVKDFVSCLTEPGSHDGAEPDVVHDCSASEALRLGSVFREQLPLEIAHLKELGEAHEEVTKEHERALGDLERLGAGAVVKDLLDQASAAGALVGRLDEKINVGELELAKVDSVFGKIREEIKQIEGVQSLSKTGDDPLTRAGKARFGIERYLEHLQDEKNGEMSTAVLKAFNTLIRKNDLLSSVELDPQSGWFREITSRHGHAMKPDHLSEGEKQMLALSYLWALIKCDGREFPVVIDTPFGRLDSVHRRNIVEKFLVKDLSQVVLLVTDEEANDKFFDAVGAHVARSYHLSHCQETGVTKVELDEVEAELCEVQG